MKIYVNFIEKLKIYVKLFKNAVQFRNNLLYYTKHQSKWFNNLIFRTKTFLNTLFPHSTQKYSNWCLDLDISKLKDCIPNLWKWKLEEARNSFFDLRDLLPFSEIALSVVGSVRRFHLGQPFA